MFQFAGLLQRAALSAAGGAAALQASSTAQATSTGALTTGIPLTGAAQALAASTATLTTGGSGLSAASVAQATATGALTTGIRLTAASLAQATSTGSLAGAAAALQAASVAVSVSTGTLTTGIALASYSGALAGSSAALTTAIRLTGAAAALVTSTGALQIALPTTTLADDLTPFFSAMTTAATWAGQAAQVLLDDAHESVLGGRALSETFNVTIPATTWAAIKRGDVVTMDGGTYSVRTVRDIEDGRIRRVTLSLDAGAAPSNFFGAADLALMFTAGEFAQVAYWNGKQANVLLDAPELDELTGMALSSEYAARMRRADLPGVDRGSIIAIPPYTYSVRDVRVEGDGSVKMLRLTRV